MYEQAKYNKHARASIRARKHLTGEERKSEERERGGERDGERREREKREGREREGGGGGSRNLIAALGNLTQEP